MSTAASKYEVLIEILKGLRGAIVAFSGGVDSTFLLAAAKESLGDRVVAAIGCSPTLPIRERDAAVSLASSLGVRHLMIETDEMSNPEFISNTPNRCFVCKSMLFRRILAVEEAAAGWQVIEGTNADDANDFRPGRAATRALGVRSPLAEAGFQKNEIRELSRIKGLKTWNKAAMACLSSRIPYGEEITVERLKRIELAEEELARLEIGQLRVRDHGLVARIEVPPEKLAELVKPTLRAQVIAAVKRAGFRYASLDLEGYRTGSMNESLSIPGRNAAAGEQ